MAVYPFDIISFNNLPIHNLGTIEIQSKTTRFTHIAMAKPCTIRLMFTVFSRVPTLF